MRCDELIAYLPQLAYDELAAHEAALCQQHLADCPACRAELASVQQALGLLDRVPAYDAQLDLAAVCLRMATRQRRQRRQRRVVLGVVAAAAGVLLAFFLRTFDVAVEPGRMVLAWHQQQRPTTPSESGMQISGNAVIAQQSPERAATQGTAIEYRSASDDADALLDWTSGDAVLAAVRRHELLESTSPGLRQALRYSQPAPPKSKSRGAGSTYNELRRELLLQRFDTPDA